MAINGSLLNIKPIVHIAAFALCSLSSCTNPIPEELPNILWLTSEDNSPLLGSYGDSFATTPNLDRLASQGFLYSHAYANAPVCAPARNAIITGVYPTAGGNQNMRSTYPISELVITFPHYLKYWGYYCTNNAKTDYNTASIDPAVIWDESSQLAHYKNREPGQPFFAVFNTMITHESSLHRRRPSEVLRHKPEEVVLPPYHPDTEEIRYDWAKYYDHIEDMDSWVGEKLKELEDLGLAENTIVFYYGDHGGVLARSKRFVYETGTRVPLIIRIPEKYKHLYPAKEPGSVIDRLVTFVDLAPTLLSIVGIEIPKWMQGKAFLGNKKSKDPEFAHMFRDRMDERYDMSRAVRDKKFRYIKNYMPHRIYGQHLSYLWQAPSMRSWEEAYLNGHCNEIQRRFWETKPSEELYDTENDPWEVNNLAQDPQYEKVLKRMRKANKEFVLKIGDTGFIPEVDLEIRRGSMASYDYIRQNPELLASIFDAAEMASMASTKNLAQLIEFTKSDESAIRYWGALGMLILKESALPARNQLLLLMDDTSPSVAITASEALLHFGEGELVVKRLLDWLNHENLYIRTYAINALEALSSTNQDYIGSLSEFISNSVPTQDQYDVWAARRLLEKWEASFALQN